MADEFVVELFPTAADDLERLFDFLLDQAITPEDLDRAQAAIDAIRALRSTAWRSNALQLSQSSAEPGAA